MVHVCDNLVSSLVQGDIKSNISKARSPLHCLNGVLTSNIKAIQSKVEHKIDLNTTAKLKLYSTSSRRWRCKAVETVTELDQVYQVERS